MRAHRLPSFVLALVATLGLLAGSAVAQTGDTATNIRTSDFNNKSQEMPSAVQQHFDSAQGYIQRIRSLEAKAEADGGELSKRDQKKLDKYYEKAFKHLEATIEESPEWIEPRIFLGALHFNRQEFVEARDCYQGVLEIDPEHEGAKSYLVATEQQLAATGGQDSDG